MKIILLISFIMASVVSTACPFCDSNIASQIRASLANDLAYNLVVMLLPFVIIAPIVFAVNKYLSLKKNRQ